MARSALNFFSLLAFTAGLLACSEPTPGLGNQQADAGTANGTDEGGPDAQTVASPDAGSDAGRPARDGGPTPDAGAPDLGPPVRTIETSALIPPRDLESLVLLPNFEPNALNGSWLALPLSTAAVAPTFDRRFWSDAPTRRPEVAILPGTDTYAPGAGLYGFGVSPGTDVEGEIWLALEDPEESDWAALTSGLIVYAQALGPALVIFEGRPEEERETLGRTWRPFGARAGVPIFGHFVIGVQNEGPGSVWINGPRVMSVSAEGARVPPPSPLPPSWQPVLHRLPQ